MPQNQDNQSTITITTVNGVPTAAAVVKAFAPIGADAITIITDALEGLQQALRAQLKARAEELLAPIPSGPYYLLSNSPKANLICKGIPAGELPIIRLIGADGPGAIFPLKDMMVGMTMMAKAQTEGAAMVIRGNEGAITIITHDQLKAAKALLTIPESLMEADAKDRWNRALRLVRTYEALG